jgi:hypothetical protein
MADINGHITRFSDSSLYDEKCVNCGGTDAYNGGLYKKCPTPGQPYKSEQDYRDTVAKMRQLAGGETPV